MNPWPPLSLLLTIHASALAEPVTAERIVELPATEQTLWKAYLQASQACAAADEAALRAELNANHMDKALRAPSGGDFKLSAEDGDAWFASDEAKLLADIILSYQAPSGGWSKHTGYGSGPRKPGMQWTSQSEPGKHPHYLATFDNRSTTEQLRLLAGVWKATKREDCKAGFIKGLNFIFAAQYPNGGWPQVYPLEGGYHDSITLNDDAMTHVLELLQSVKDPGFALIDDALRAKAAAAFAKGIDCLLKAQVSRDGKKTAWCAQHDALTLKPESARKMEPATLSGQESANLLKFLMTIPKPSAEVKASIESGLEWLDRVKITGLAKTKREGKTAYEPNASSTEIYWARFYRLENGRPVFPGRDGVLYGSFNEMAAGNTLGYDYYTTRPASLLSNGQKKWRKEIARAEEK